MRPDLRIFRMSGEAAKASRLHVQQSASRDEDAAAGSVIIHDFAIKSSFFMSLGACRLKRRILVLMVGLCASLSFVSCGGSSKPKDPPSGLTERVLASQGVTRVLRFWRTGDHQRPERHSAAGRSDRAPEVPRD